MKLSKMQTHSSYLAEQIFKPIWGEWRKIMHHFPTKGGENNQEFWNKLKEEFEILFELGILMYIRLYHNNFYIILF